MRTILAACLLIGLLATTADAQSFRPKNYPDCVMIFAKRAASRDGAMLMRRACKCRFQDAGREECKDYSRMALDCMLSNLIPVATDDEAWGVERACRTKFPVK
jgi:hypothetical protein